MDKLAGDVTLEGSMLDGAVQGADAIRAVISGVRELCDRQDFTSPALVLLQHFRGNLDNWDPALVD